MRNIATVTIFLVALNTALASQAPDVSVMVQERLARMAGSWRIEERYAGDSAIYVKTSTCELFAGGRHLVCHSEAETPIGPSKSIGILSYEPMDRTFVQYAIASVGVATLIKGTVSESAWIGTTEFAFNGQMVSARVTVNDATPGSWTYQMEAALGGSRSIVIHEAKATKLR
jgi:hypothetical protein